MVLADLGADVVRIDKLADVDQGPPIDGVMRRNQRSVAIDLKDPRGRDLTRSLADAADAFVDVYRPGVAERLGVGPEDLLERNPQLVYARMTGYGQDGPYAAMAGHDINYIALSGALHAIGPADAPVPPLNLIGDFGGGGMLLAVGLLSGVLEARATGDRSGDRRVHARRCRPAARADLRPAGPGRVAGPAPVQRGRRRRPLLPDLRDRRRQAFLGGRH